MTRTLSVLVGIGVFASSLHAQSLSVSVRDTSGAPLPQATVLLLDRSGKLVSSARTNKDGAAWIAHADTGRFLLHARRFGFKPRYSDEVHIGPNDSVVVRLTLEAAPAVLSTVVVTTQRDSVRGEWNPFGIDLKATGGYIVTPMEVEQAIIGSRDMADVLARRAVPGITINQRLRCPMSTRVPGCLPFVVDGQMYPVGASFPDVVVPEMVDYIVVLRGSEVGVRYGSVGQNGIILIATKRADWWRRRK